MLSDGGNAQNKDNRKLFLLTFLPPTIWIVLFLLVPTVIIIVYSFSQKDGLINIQLTWVLDNYRRVADPLYLKILIKSIYIAGITTFLCLVISFPVALSITKIQQNWRLTVLILLMLPFWINLLIRTYALIAVLRTRGVLNSGLEWFATRMGIAFEPIPFLYNDAAIIIGLVYIHLPFMILPIYAGLEGFDETLKQAAEDLGSSTAQLYRYIV
ncbi:MAG: ABC transporter permease, partial [Pseudomonadota bacterium]|nr:ABC transporter permease [Pseudomonadota bacterium]